MQVATRISAVTVYRNGALVVREGAVPSGTAGEVEVAGLPLLFSSDTLRVRPKSGAVRDLRESVRLEATPAPVPVDEERLLEIRLELQRVDDEIATCATLLEVLGGLAPELPNPRAPMSTGLIGAQLFVDLVAFGAKSSADLADKRRALQVKRRELEREKRRLEERAQAVPQTEPRVLRGVRFALDGEGPFALEYFVRAARWLPSYALHLDGGRGRLVVAALVAQASGEDWSGARLSVCTADLAREATLPTLSSWRIGRAQAAPLRAYRPLPTDLPSLFHGYDHGPRRAPPPAAPPPPPPLHQTIFSDDERTGAGVHGSIGGVPKDSRSESALDELSASDDEYANTGSDGSMPEESAKRAYDAPITKTGIAMMPQSQSRPMAPPSMSSMPMPASAPMPMAPGAMPMPSRSRSAGPPQPQRGPSPKLAKKGGGFAFGSGGGGGDSSRDEGGGFAGEDDDVVRVDNELPPRLRTAYMRMAGPDEPQRGSLLPLDPTARLAWLLEASANDSGASANDLRRAVDALQRAENRLLHGALPRGTSVLDGTHFPQVLTAPSAADVPGDGAYYRVEVRVDEGAATTEHRAVPRESNDVWRTCKLDVAKGPALPAGPLTVYEGGAFKVNARLDGQGGGKPVEVNLGVDPDVRVLARTVHVNQSEKGLVSSTSRVEHKIHMDIRSTRKEPASVVLYDRLPVPSDNVKDVVVTVVDEKPPLKRTSKDAFGNEVVGGFAWHITVMPGDTHGVDLTYTIDVPSKTELEGGNRRE